ncbi:MAG: WecB/TagA/CpsF family glycosyltransferase [Planctomycetota bacterium]
MKRDFDTTDVLGVPYAELDYSAASDVILGWAEEQSHRMVVVAPVSSLIMSKKNTTLGAAFERADMVASDGVPIVWARRMMGRPNATRLYGPDLMLEVMQACERAGVPVALLGGRPERLQRLRDEIARRFPTLKVPYAWSPPFRELSDTEVIDVAEDIAVSGARVVFVGVGCPKQEILMHRLSAMLPAVQIGVGAAFDFIPGFVRQAPERLQRMGLEWAYRVACEPGRLWKRYATTIPPFVAQVCIQVIAHALMATGRAVKGTA